jgi:hypothetical protein
VTHVVYTDNNTRRYYWTFKRPGVPPLKGS